MHGSQNDVPDWPIRVCSVQDFFRKADNNVWPRRYAISHDEFH